MNIVEGETVFVCNIYSKGLDNEQEITKHIEENHESCMSWETKFFVSLEIFGLMILLKQCVNYSKFENATKIRK